jgi:hypothetical protein
MRIAEQSQKEVRCGGEGGGKRMIQAIEDEA